MSLSSVSVTPIERAAIPELAMLMHEYVTGRHYSAPDDVERQRWISGMERFLGVLVETDNVKMTP